MTADKTAVPEWIDVAFADGFGWSTYAAHEGDKTRFIRSDLCASGQVQAVMDAADRDADRCAERITELEAALEKARAEAKRMDLARDQFLGERNMLAKALREIQRGDMTGMMELTEAEAARTRATWAIKRIGTPVAALTPAPQPEGLDNPSGMACTACRSVGAWHCSDPENCGGMKPMRSACTCNEPWCKACAPAPSAATPTAQEPEAIRYSFDGDGWLYADRGNGGDWLERALDYPDAEPLYTAITLYAHPPQPSETVAEAARALINAYSRDDNLGRTLVRLAGEAQKYSPAAEAFLLEVSALCALKGGE